MTLFLFVCDVRGVWGDVIRETFTDPHATQLRLSFLNIITNISAHLPQSPRRPISCLGSCIFSRRQNFLYKHQESIGPHLYDVNEPCQAPPVNKVLLNWFMVYNLLSLLITFRSVTLFNKNSDIIWICVMSSIDKCHLYHTQVIEVTFVWTNYTTLPHYEPKIF